MNIDGAESIFEEIMAENVSHPNERNQPTHSRGPTHPR